MQVAANTAKNQMYVAKQADIQFTNSMDMKVSDEQLMLKYAQGDALAFEQLYERHNGSLFRYCLRQLNNRPRAEECFQEIWIKLINSRVNYQPKALFTTYLYRIAQNHIIDTFRKDKKRRQETELDEEFHSGVEEAIENDMSSQIMRQKQYQLLRSEIESLPQEQKTALLLKLDAGLSLEEISIVLNCGRETVKSRLRYATKRLKTLLGEIK